MEGPWSDYGPAPVAGPWTDYAAAKPAPPPSKAFTQGRASAKKGILGGLTGAVTTMEEAIPFADEAQAAISTVGRVAQGEGLGEAWRNSRDYQRGLMTGLREDHPVVSNLSTGAGLSVDAVPILLSGGAAAPEVASSVGARVGTTLAQRGGQMLMTGARNAATGATIAAAQGLAGRGTMTDRARAAGAAAGPGAAVGFAAPIVGAAAGAAVRKGGEVLASVGRTAVRAANKAASATASGAFLDPTEQAISRLGEAMRKDGLTGPQIAAATDEWNRVGGASPAFVDIVSQDGGGQNTMALIRGAAMSGTARNVATRHATRVTADLQDTAIARTRAMTDDQRPAEQVVDTLRRQRRSTANEQYPAFAEVRVPVGDDILSAADGAAQWMQQAADLAVAERKFDVANEIASLVNGEKPRTVTAGALDYMRRSLRDASQSAFTQSKGSLGQALKDRASELETALMDVPGFRTARDTYRGFSQQMEAVDGNPAQGAYGGRQVMTAPPDEFRTSMTRRTEAAQPYVAVGARQEITDAIGKPAEGSTGLLNRLGSGTNVGRNLTAVFGEEPAADYQTSIRNIVGQVHNARSINPMTNSLTAARTADERLVEAVESMPKSKMGLIASIIGKFRAGLTLTDAEREALLQIATGPAEAGMMRVAPRLPAPPLPPVRMTGRPPVSPVLLGAAQDNRR
jgi:hypothetical protein